MDRLASKMSWLFNSKPPGQVHTPERYLYLIKRCMERVQKMTLLSVSTSPKFNHGQCRYLAHKLNTAVKNANYILLHLRRFESLPQEAIMMVDCLEAFKLLYALAIEVENFIQSCCKDAWTEAAVTLTDVSEHISSIGFDLELWTVFCHGRKALVAEVDTTFQAEVEVVKEQASLDKERLLRKTSALLQKRKLTSLKHEQASLLLERLQRSRLIPTGDSAIQFQSSHSGKVVRDLQQLEALGKGSAATVYKAMWLGAEFAKKTFYGPENPDFEKEVSILISLSHPNITSLLCYAKSKHECSIVMELMDEDLFSLMQRRLKVDEARAFPFGILEAVNIMHQIGEGMYYLHEMRIVHRDLKSMNILVKHVKTSESEIEYMQVKVADFGMSRTKERSMTHSNQTLNIGTTRWMAPEMIKCLDSESSIENKASIVQYPFKCDIYSFAMVCYEILSGERPFSNTFNASVIKKKVLNGERPKLPTHCHEVLKSLIERCWSLNASQRPSFGDICTELRHLKFVLLMPSALKWDFGFQHTGSAEEDDDTFLKTLPWLPPRFSFKDLDIATKHFSKLLGKGGFGTVYEGILLDGSKVAVKRLQGRKDLFRAEVAIIGGINHLRLVHLLGFCSKGAQRMLVYECMDNGSLDLWLFRDSVLDWAVRYQIAVDTAQALSYLHQDCRHTIVHLDVKPHNILLDNQFRAKVADFGLSKVLSEQGMTEDSTTTSWIPGTSGYQAPELFLRTSARITVRCDVYSYGMVLLEIVSGRRNMDSFTASPEKWYFPRWAVQKTQEQAWKEIVDVCLESSLTSEDLVQVSRVVKIAMWCIQDNPLLRPTMATVVQMLEGVVEVDDPPLQFDYLGRAGPPYIANSSSGSLVIPSENMRDSYCEPNSNSILSPR